MLAEAFLLASIATARGPCDALLEKAPRDPLSAECFRELVTREEAEVLAQRLRRWLDRRPDDPWLLVTSGGQTLESASPGARESIARARDGFVERQEAPGEAYARLLLARDAQRRRALDVLGRELEAARPLVQALRDPTLIAWLAFVEATELSFDSRYEEAIPALRELALADAFDQLPRRLRYHVLVQLAASARHAARFSESLAFEREATAICGESPTCRTEHATRYAETLRNMGVVGLASRADVVRATRAAYDAARESNKPALELLSICFLGEWTPLPESLEWNRLCEEKATAPWCVDLRMWARLRHAEGLARTDPTQVPHSRALLEQLARDEENFPNAQDPSSIVYTLAQVHKLAGDSDEAIRALETAIEMREEVRDRGATPEARASVLSRSALYYHDLAAYLALEVGDLDRAFATLEALRGRAWHDLVALAAGEPAPDGPEVDDLADTLAEIAAVQSRLGDSALAGSERDAALRELERLELREEELAAAIARANPAWGETRRPHVAALAEIERKLDADEALVLIQLPPPDVAAPWALVATSAGSRAVRLGAFDASMLRLYLGAIESRADPPPVMSLALQQAVVGPVIEELSPTTRRLVIVPDGPVARLPLAALPDPRTGRPLIERFELVLVSSATSWARERGAAGLLAPAALGFADVTRSRPPAPLDPARGADLAIEALALPRSRREVRSLVDRIGGASRALYADDASEAELRRLDLAPFGIVHFATHALVNGSRPSRSAILLATGSASEDGLLQPREIAMLALAGKLVVLSACSSGDGRELDGEGPLSLGRAFLGAGARAVVATVWPVRDSEAAALAERFYGRLARGEPASAALAGAQRELHAEGAPVAAWAGFVLMGDGDAALPALPERTAPPARWLAAGAALGGLALVAWFLRRRAV